MTDAGTTIRHCVQCLTPSSRPRVSFDDAGVCNACRFVEAKQSIDWHARHDEFLKLLDQHRGSGQYDCIVPMSGGKDSASIAYKLKHTYGMHPLCVCYGQLLWTDAGRHNMDRVAQSVGDILYWRVDQRVSRVLAKRFTIERGHPKQHYDAGVNAVPLQTAVAFQIPLVFYAEHGESEYGGRVLDAESTRHRNLTEVLEHQVGDDPGNWVGEGITEADLAPYRYPPNVEGVTAYYWTHFHQWNVAQNARFCEEFMGFQYDKRSDGSFVGYDSIDDKIDDLDYHLMAVKFLMGRSTRMASRLIRYKEMTLAEAREAILKYDYEFPTRYLRDILDYLDMTYDELIEVIDMHRNKELWDRKDGVWVPKFRIP